MAGGAILLVDDDDAIRVVVAQALRRAGHNVRTASSIADLDRELAAGRLPAQGGASSTIR